jgi:hypothetical protein
MSIVTANYLEVLQFKISGFYWENEKLLFLLVYSNLSYTHTLCMIFQGGYQILEIQIARFFPLKE